MPKTVVVDKYANVPNFWLMHARMNLDGARVLFTHESALTLCIPAAALGHLALEGFLKTALILEGFTVFDPKKLKQLGTTTLTVDKCVWGHDLVELARLLASKRVELDLQRPFQDFLPPYGYPITIERGLHVFNTFFGELRYPQESDQLEGIGPDDIHLLDALVEALRPFVGWQP